jgi:outer membrane protein OmpA-like peptidoglycan-associated protein
MKKWLLHIFLFAAFISTHEVDSYLYGQESNEELPIVNGELGTSKCKINPKRTKKNYFQSYTVFANHPEVNSLWLSYLIPYDGDLTLSVDIGSSPLQLVVFKIFGDDPAQELLSGKAEIQRLILTPESGSIALTKENYLPTQNRLYPLKVKQGQHLLFYFNTTNVNIRTIFLKTHIEHGRSTDDVQADQKVLDLRENDLFNTLSIKVRDSETGLPITASVNIDGMKKMSNYYVASDLFFDIERAKQIHIKCDAEGFFFYDKEFKIADDDDNEIIVLLERLAEGKKLKLPEIQFEMGTTNPTGNAMRIMDRLADFLTTNPAVRIEIQGHVHEVGNNSLAAKKISEARAKRVLIYLVDKGISPDRLEYKGFGNTQMIYPLPKNIYEEQANRRVEIQIL